MSAAAWLLAGLALAAALCRAFAAWRDSGWILQALSLPVC